MFLTKWLTAFLCLCQIPAFTKESVSRYSNMIDLTTLHSWIESHDELTLVDVRTHQEYRSSHIQGSLHIPITELEARIKEVPQDKKIVIYCAHGSRAKRAKEILDVHHFANVYYVKGDIENWKSAGLPVSS